MNTKTPAEAQAPAQETAVAVTKTATETPAEAEGDGDEAEAEAGDEAEEGSEEKPEAEAEAEAGTETKPTKSALRREKQKARVEALEAEVRRLNDLAGATERNKPALDELGPKPERDKYEDEAEFISDLSAWKTEKALLDRQSKSHKTNSETTRGDAAAAKHNLFRERAMALTDRYPDIEAKVFNDPTLPMSATMAETIMESEKGAEIAYYLASNRETAQRIKSMAPLAAAMEIGRIEAKLSLPKPRTETKAPPPPSTVSGSVKGPAQKLEDLSMAAYKKARGYDK